jgi:hypothetical protein
VRRRQRASRYHCFCFVEQSPKNAAELRPPRVFVGVWVQKRERDRGRSGRQAGREGGRVLLCCVEVCLRVWVGGCVCVCMCG